MSPMLPRVLIADDQEVILQSLGAALECANLEVCGVAKDGAEALIKAQELRPDLIILDLTMPVMNGLEAARQIGRILPNVPMLLYTLTDTPQVRREGLQAGIRQVVSKSAGTGVLLREVETALRRPANEKSVAPARIGNALPLAVTSAEQPDRSGQLVDSSETDPPKAS